MFTESLGRPGRFNKGAELINTNKKTRKGRPTTEDSEEILARLLEVATQQFAELGYRPVTMRAVADLAQVSTRTLYNRFADKVSLFTACLEAGSNIFPIPDPRPGEDIRSVLQRYAASVVSALSLDTSLRLGMLVSREGADFPELVRATEDTQARHLVRPLTEYLQTLRLPAREAETMAKLFLAMAISEWQRRVAFRRPLPSAAAQQRHAAMVADFFVRGAQLKQPTPAVARRR
jgi:TetR/AcrR family transcriptional repressor of mexJK operon